MPQKDVASMRSPTGYYKVLHENGRPHMGSGKWTVGKKRSVHGGLRLCSNGLHLCDKAHLLDFLNYGPCIHPVVEMSDERVADGEKVAVRWCVLGPAYPGWNERTARLFAADCAERALRRERKAGREPDVRLWAAVQAARAFADGKISKEERDAAGDAAGAATDDAAWAAARAAAWAAAWAAARDAAGDAARDAAWDAAGAAARDAAGDAARAAERRWQSKRLFDYIEGKRG